MKATTHYIYIAIVAIATAVCCLPACAQTRKVMNRPYVDQQQFHYGFFAGVHLQDLEMKHNGYVADDGSQWFVDQPNYEPGFSVGILGERLLMKHLSLRVLPTMHFGTKNLVLRNDVTKERQYQTIKSTYISLPIDVKFAAERFNNYRPYAMVGVDPMYDLTVKRQKQVLLKPFDCYLECGIGCDFYMPYFKFIPEVKFCWGLADIINHDRSDLTDVNQQVFTKSISSGQSKMVVVTFYFE